MQHRQTTMPVIGNDMQALINFLCTYEPLYRQIVKGYSPSEIAQLEEALGHPVPPVQHDFLSTAAANVGFFVGEFTFDMAELIELAIYKREMLANMSNVLTPVAVDLSQSSADYYIHLGRSINSDGDGEIVRSGTGSIDFDDIHAYPSLRDMLFFLGFHRIRMLALEHRCEIVWYFQDFPENGTAPSPDTLHSLLEQLCFRPLNVTGPTVPLYERGDCAASVYKHWTTETFSVYIAARDRRVVDEIVETLSDNMPIPGERYPD